MAQSADAAPATRSIRVALAVSGSIALIVGLLILLWPGRTAEVAVGIISIYVVIAGIVNISLGIFWRSGWPRLGYIVLGALFIIAGVFAFSNLLATTAWVGVLAGMLVGVLWIVEGIVSLISSRNASSKTWTVIFAIMSIVAGVILLFSPLLGAVLLFVLMGASLVVLGVFQLIRAFRFGK